MESWIHQRLYITARTNASISLLGQVHCIDLLYCLSSFTFISNDDVYVFFYKWPVTSVLTWYLKLMECYNGVLCFYSITMSVLHVLNAMFHKAFHVEDQDQVQVKVILLWIFIQTFYTYLTIDCWYPIKHVLQTRLLGIQSFFYEIISKCYSCDRYENLSTLNNRINFIKVNCLQRVL